MSGPAAPAPSSDLQVSLSDGDATFADEINARHRNFVACARTALEEAIRIGELLIANKQAVPHGAWLNWLKKNITFDIRTAQNYMRLFEQRHLLPNTKPISYLTDALALLAKKTDRKAARANVEQQAAVSSDSEPKPDVADTEQKPKSVEDENPTGPEDEKAIWRKGLLERARHATSLAAYDETWANYSFDAEVIDATAQAAAAWNELAMYLRERQLPF
jgi:hypothetical protein